MPKSSLDFDYWFKRVLGYTPYPYQSQLASANRLPDVIQAPTGAGKTATAIMPWMWRKLEATPEINQSTPTRLVIVEPQRTLTEQIFADAKKWRTAAGWDDKKLHVQLMQGGAVNREWVKFPDIPTIIVGTQDQVLSRCLMRGYGESRFAWPMSFAFLNNDTLFVFDEVQLMGIGFPTSVQLQGLRQRFGTYGSTHSIWMSATLDQEQLQTVDHDASQLRFHRLSEADYQHPKLTVRLNASKPLLKANAVLGDKKYIKNLASEVLAAHTKGTLTLVICNQVERAQELYLEVSKQNPNDTHLVHSRFRAAERTGLNKQLQDRNLNGILIATQAVEAGIDISARVLFTELAPWSSVVQRVGRCNRCGTQPNPQVYWIDSDLKKNNITLPYSVEELEFSKQHLEKLPDVGRATIAHINAPSKECEGLIPRACDLQELFDISADLTGADIDVSAYIRESDDSDVSVVWRDFESGSPGKDEPLPTQPEICRVNCWKLKSFIEKQKVACHTLNPVKGWLKTSRIYPGQTVLLPRKAGGYDPKLGYTGTLNHIPPIVDREQDFTPELFEQDPWTFLPNDFVNLTQHSIDITEQMQLLLGVFKPFGLPEAELLVAARWHDLGKALPDFQGMLVGDDTTRQGTLWAKSNKSGSRMPKDRQGFRHELLSALVALKHEKTFLTAYLIAAHHGKVRLSLTPRESDRATYNQLCTQGMNVRVSYGVRDGDAVQTVDLGGEVKVSPTTVDLELMELGAGSWLEQSQQLLETWGPFRLAFLEAIVRIADWRASASDNT
jgi:CRISPR-associated endonuclease/helicase Cas3